jgi:DNA-binding response OmpR family regulator
MTRDQRHDAVPRVLVIDDDAGIRDMLTLALRSEGFTVDASDGRTVDLPILAEVILLDYRLAGRTAEALIEETPALLDRPIVLMTASADAGVVMAPIPAVSVIRKPFDLRVVIAAVIEAGHSRSSAAGKGPTSG